MLSKQFGLIFTVVLGMSFPVIGADEQHQPKQLLIDRYPTIKEFHETFKDKSIPQDVAEQILLAFLHNGVEFKDGHFVIDVKKGATETRNALAKGAVYKLLHTAVQQSVFKLKTFPSAKKEKEFEVTYKNWIKPVVGDGIDVVARGIKYFNDDTKEQTVSAYLKDDFAPYLVKKKIVWITQLAVRKALERYEYGRWIAGAYDIACIIPVIGVEIEDAPKNVLGFFYDKGVAVGKEIVQKHVLPKMKSSSTTTLQTA